MNKPIRNIEYIKGQSPLKYQTHDIIIPAAGCSTRMKVAGTKSLIYISDKRIVDRQIENINEVFNKKNIFVVSGFESEKVMNYLGNRVINLENENYENTNVSRSIAIGLRACQSSSVIIIYGDLFFTKNAINHAYRNQSFIVISETMTDNEVGCVIHNENVENIFYEIPNKWGQIAYFTGKELSLLKKIVFNRENNKMFGYEIINKIIDMGGNFKAIRPIETYIQDIDTAKDLLLVEKYINENYSKFKN
jgi:choline kinase